MCRQQCFDLDYITKFRQSWKNTGTAAVKKLDSLRTFCRFGVERKRMDENYAKKLAKPEDAESFHCHRMRSESESQFACAARLPVKSALP